MSLITKEMKNDSVGKFVNAKFFRDNPVKARIQDIIRGKADNPRYADPQGKSNKIVYLDEDGQEKILNSSAMDLLRQLVLIDPDVDDLLEIYNEKIEGEKGDYVKWYVKKIDEGKAKTKKDEPSKEDLEKIGF